MIPQRPLHPTQPLPPLLWDVFCKVIDNHGDLGVCWRLCSQLASLGHRVRLWVDQSHALAWMAPQGQARIDVLPWPSNACPDLAPADVWLETFGCGLSDAFLNHFRAQLSATQKPTPPWFNLEYLSAETYVERSHLLPSPISQGAGQGLTRRFFFPGFTPRTGGLLRELHLLERQSGFDRTRWLAELGIHLQPQERVVSLFCYEPAALPGLIQALAASANQATRLLVTQGRAAAAVDEVVRITANGEALKQGAQTLKHMSFSSQFVSVHLQIEYLPALTQIHFDHLLWASDVNFVRGEDSWVRALLAGKPMVWQTYPQDDAAHHAKLNAFLDWSDAPADVRQLHQAWNDLAMGTAPPPWHLLDVLHASHQHWLEWMSQVKSRLMASEDLVTQLLRAVQADLKSAIQP